ncbi:MAG: hypothetical protein RL119_1992 [Actinomycetota bacterium]|jgi:cell division protein FtsX
MASALNDTSREIGGAIGVALLGSILSAGYRSSVEANLTGVPKDTLELASQGIGGAFAVAAIVLAAGVFVYLVFRGPHIRTIE